jgi:integrase
VAKRRKKGDGLIYRRKDGRWEGRVVVGYDGNGLPITKNVLAKTKYECAEKLEKLKDKRPDCTPAEYSRSMTFGEWIDYWYNTFCKPALRDSTASGYESHIYNHIISDIGDIPLCKLKQNNLQQFYSDLKSKGRKTRTEIYGTGLSDRTVRAVHACCRAALDKAVKMKLIRVNPADMCRLPPKKGKEKQILSDDEMRRLMIQAKEDGFYEMFLLDLSTGMRRGELLALKWDDIDLQSGEIRISKQVKIKNGQTVISAPKTKNAVRSIIVPPEITGILKEYKETVNSEWVFPSPIKDDAPRDPTACRKSLTKILERAGCKHVRFHDLRHTFATNALKYGMDVKTLAATIGHASAETTLDIYSHVTDDMKRQAAKRIDAVINGTKSVPDETAGVTTKKFETVFEPYKGKIRKRGTGCISRINENTWEGRYAPKIDGKRIQRVVYAHSEEDCEEKLKELIAEMNAEKARKI